MVTNLPTLPVVGERLVILSPSGTVKPSVLLAMLLTVTTTFPVVAPVGTGTTIDPLPQVVGVAVVPLNFTVLVPCVEPKLLPVMVTDVPTGPVVGERFVMLGAATTVNKELLLATPFTATTTFPVVAPVGTVATIDVWVQLVIAVAAVPLNFNVLVP